MKKVAKIIAIIGLVLIISGLIIEIIVLNNKNKELNTQLMENYYMNVSEYRGEYYE